MHSVIEMSLRIIFGLQMVFWGLNGLFHWLPLPPQSATLTRFVEACIETRFIMPVVKFLEIACGLCLLTGFLVPGSLLILAPIMFVITGLQIFHNPKPWGVLATCTLPYLILLCLHGPTLLRVVH